jgi:hypothetical protein
MRRLIAIFCLGTLLAGCGGSDSGSSLDATSSQPAENSSIVAVITGKQSDLITGDMLRFTAQQSATQTDATYRWTLVDKPAGSLALLQGDKTVDAQFIADTAGEYKLNLTVTVASQSKTSSVVIRVAANQSPIVDLQTPKLQNLLTDKGIRFDAAASRDPELRSLQMRWQVEAEPVGSNLVLPQQSVLEFTPVVAGDYKIKLTVTDGVNTVSEQRSFTVYKSALTLKADANSGMSAAQQVTAFFGEGSLDMPQTHATTEHLKIATDEVVGPHFLFTLHLKEDGDRDIAFKNTDRQRAEIKSYSQSADALLCREGDRMEVDFSFKTDDIQVSTSFTHLFQLKGKADNPLFTLSAQKTSGETALRLNHVQGTTKLSPLAAVQWDQVRNTWLAITLKFSCGQQGYLDVLIKDAKTGQTTYLNKKFSGLKMWQDVSNDVYGIKTGLYRKIKDDCIPAQADATKSCADVNVMKSGFTRLEDSVRLGHLTIRKL